MALTPAVAQTAFRCDQGGQTVYSDKPCPAGETGKAVAPTHDSAAQKAASKQAGDQMRQDSADLNKRLSAREKMEAQERAAARKAAGKAAAEKPKSAKSGKSSTKAKTSAARAKGSGSRKSTAKGKSASGAVTRPAGT